MTVCAPESGSTLGKRCPFQYSLRTLLVFLLLVSAGLSVFAVVAERARRAVRLSGTRRAFVWVFECLSAYDERWGHLPETVRCDTVRAKTEIGMPNGNGRPLYSWRGELSPWTRCGYPGYVQNLSEPWDSATNRNAESAGPGPYCYASHDGNWGQVSWTTNMLAICGPGTAFGYQREPPRSLRTLGSNAILVVEVRDSGIHWMQPGDVDIRDMPHTINAADGHGISSRYAGGFHVLFSDGAVWFLSDKIPFDTLARFFTVDEANTYNREEVLGAFVVSRSSL